MKNLKCKISLLILLAILVFSIGVVYGASDYSAKSNNMTLTVTSGSTVVKTGDVVTLGPGKSFNISVDSSSPYVEIGYYFVSENNIKLFPEGQKTGKVTVPNYEEGSKIIVRVDAIINQEGLHEKVGPVDFYVQIPELSVKTNRSEMSTTKTLLMDVGQKISILTRGDVKQIAYKWDSEPSKSVNYASEDNLTVPNYEPGSTHKFQVVVAYMDGTLLNRVYTIKIKEVEEDETDPEPATTVSTKLTFNNSTVSNGKTIEADNGEKLYVTPSCNKGDPTVTYEWDNNGEKPLVTGTTKTAITVPDDFKPGTTHKLTIRATAPDGTKAKEMVYYIKIPEAIDDEFIIEDWMKENKDLEGLAVSLRTDSENEDKANKNMYSLGEEIIYYIDYANESSKDISEAKIVFETELDFDIVDAFGGEVNGKKVTWEFSRGLEKGQKGTKVLVLKYNSLGKNSVKSKVIHPVADIYSGKKVADSSAVVNLIFKDSDTEITNDEHYPYMYGDADKPTFRPDDTITRAEGALVLTRIFGMNTSGTSVKKVFSDLDETYLEAQKAIVAATNAGIINGYEDGTYRPNEPMSRAEFMKIIAKYVELDAEENDIRGMNIKGLEEDLKVYKNKTANHWSLPCITYLARLNMTPVSSKNKDLRLDDKITRAEVAQLVNFYLLRAPAVVSSKTKSGFTDVNKSHKLFADIIEATREAHTYYITEEAREQVD